MSTERLAGTLIIEAMEKAAAAARANGYTHGLAKALELMNKNGEWGTPAYYAIYDLHQRLPNHLNLNCDVPDEAPTT